MRLLRLSCILALVSSLSLSGSVGDTLTSDSLTGDALRGTTARGKPADLPFDYSWKYRDSTDLSIDFNEAPSVPSLRLKTPPDRSALERPRFSLGIMAEAYPVNMADEFKDLTTMQVGLQVAPSLRLSIAALYEGKVSQPPDRVALNFVSKAMHWRYLRNSTLTLVVDGERVPLADLERTGSVGTGYVLEFLGTSIPFAAFLEIVNASSVSGRLFTTDFRLEKQQLEALRDFATRLQPSGNPQPEAAGTIPTQ
jgi:hypothetical protein